MTTPPTILTDTVKLRHVIRVDDESPDARYLGAHGFVPLADATKYATFQGARIAADDRCLDDAAIETIEVPHAAR
jgi:hypothetical protein